MEVLDPSVSRDDQPLCVNDFLEKGLFSIFSYHINRITICLNIFFRDFVCNRFFGSIKNLQKPPELREGIVWKQRIGRTIHKLSTILSAVKFSEYIILRELHRSKLYFEAFFNNYFFILKTRYNYASRIFIYL